MNVCECIFDDLAGLGAKEDERPTRIFNLQQNSKTNKGIADL